MSLQISCRQPEARYKHQRTPDRKSSYQKPANHFSRSLIIRGEAVTEDPFRSPLTNKQRADEQRQPNPRSWFGEIQSHPNSLVLIVAIGPNARVVSIVIDAELQQTLRLHHHLSNRIIPNQPPLQPLQPNQFNPDGRAVLDLSKGHRAAFIERVHLTSSP